MATQARAKPKKKEKEKSTYVANLQVLWEITQKSIYQRSCRQHNKLMCHKKSM